MSVVLVKAAVVSASRIHWSFHF